MTSHKPIQPELADILDKFLGRERPDTVSPEEWLNFAHPNLLQAISKLLLQSKIEELTGLMQHHMDRNSTPPFTKLRIDVIKNRIKELSAGEGDK